MNMTGPSQEEDPHAPPRPLWMIYLWLIVPNEVGEEGIPSLLLMSSALNNLFIKLTFMLVVCVYTRAADYALALITRD